jgi:phosphoenolpyruvate carboxylase
MTWANPGPGAKRGLNRVFGREVSESLTSFQANEEMQNLLRICKEALYHEDPMFADLEMRDIEHSLCETDKYLRAKVDGRPLKQLYGIAQSSRRRTVANGSRYPTMLDQVKSKLIDSGKDVFTKEELFTIIQEIKDLGSYRKQLAEAKAKAANPLAEPLPDIPVEDEVVEDA